MPHIPKSIKKIILPRDTMNLQDFNLRPLNYSDFNHLTYISCDPLNIFRNGRFNTRYKEIDI